jgi:dolichol-phosphate mannosyltransferase
MTKRIVIIPTFNEAHNIGSLLKKIGKILPDSNVLVVDDSSPDGTGEIVKNYSKTNPKVSLLTRKEKRGLGEAYLNAFDEILKDPEVSEIAMMDADFSHKPEYLPQMFGMLSEHDVVIGSRYIRGGETVGWELWRRILSFMANLYCKLILRMSVWDATSGFYTIKTEALRRIDFSSIDVSGYAFQIEFKYLLWKQGLKLKEFPVTFVNRVGGESKISGHIVSEGIVAPWKMLFKMLLK